MNLKRRGTKDYTMPCPENPPTPNLARFQKIIESFKTKKIIPAEAEAFDLNLSKISDHKDHEYEVNSPQGIIFALRETLSIMENDVEAYKNESLKYKLHLEMSEVVKSELRNKCNQLEIKAINHLKEEALMRKMQKDNNFLAEKLLRMEKAYANQLSDMANTILKLEEMSRIKNHKQKERIADLEEQLRKVEISEGYSRSLLTGTDGNNDYCEENLHDFKSVTTHMQAKRIAELEAQLEESNYALSAFKRANTYMSDIAKGDELELRDELVKSSKDAEKFMSTLESLELDMTSDLKHLEDELSTC